MPKYSLLALVCLALATSAAIAAKSSSSTEPSAELINAIEQGSSELHRGGIKGRSSGARQLNEYEYGGEDDDGGGGSLEDYSENSRSSSKLHRRHRKQDHRIVNSEEYFLDNNNDDSDVDVINDRSAHTRQQNNNNNIFEHVITRDDDEIEEEEEDDNSRREEAQMRIPLPINEKTFSTDTGRRSNPNKKKGGDPGNPFDLPSFDATPAPPLISFREWQSRYQAARKIATQEHVERIHSKSEAVDKLHPLVSSPFAYEFTSKEGIGSGALPSDYVAACLVVRDAHDDIAEWVHHHLKYHISKIYVYDHESYPPLKMILMPWIKAGTVVYEHVSNADVEQHPSGRPQLYGYDKCLLDHGHGHRWLTFFDVDEFLIFQSGPAVQSLPVLLHPYEEYSAVAVHWILFGSSGRELRPTRGTLQSYVHCLPRNHTHHLYVKSIVNTRCTQRASSSPHVFVHNCTKPAVRTNFLPVTAQTASDLPDHSVVALHHYATRSAEEFEIKMARGSGMKRQRGWEYFNFVDAWSVEFCLAGLQVWDDNIASLPRTLAPAALQEQLERYAKDEHEDFWGAGAAAAAARKSAAAAVAKQAQKEADRWGQGDDVGVDIEEDEDGGERDYEDE